MRVRALCIAMLDIRWRTSFRSNLIRWLHAERSVYRSLDQQSSRFYRAAGTPKLRASRRFFLRRWRVCTSGGADCVLSCQRPRPRYAALCSGLPDATHNCRFRGSTAIRIARLKHAMRRSLQAGPPRSKPRSIKSQWSFHTGALADGADHETARVPAVYWSAEYSGGALHRARIVAALCNAQRARGCAVRSTGQRRKPARAQRNLHSAPSYAEARRGGARGGCDCRGDPCRTTPPMNIECGVDEAGRGPLAGPVVAAAVILDETAPIHGLADSKTLSAQKRAALFELICARARAYCIASASVEEIDRLNILNATLLAMRRAVETLAIRPTLAQIDGNRCPPLTIRAQAIVRGDAHIPAISAASILAKVARDRMLLELHAQYPEYGFDRHAGYGTRAHLAALQRYGPCVHHRRSFAPVRALLKHSHLV